ncbi:MAG: methionine ABC transporter ATP-binding protein [Culicoidibacterales bacterium]
MITFENISKQYVKDAQTITAVSDVNLTIKAGEIFGIIGYSGAGKSTLLRMINGLELPTQGSVVVDGAALQTLSANELRAQRQKIGMIFQHFNLLWSRTVAENIALALEVAKTPKAEIATRVAELITLVGLDGRADNYPSQLSGGQKQRVGIARALANNPQILLADEATSALDPETTEAILALLTDINQKLGITIVFITHEMQVVKNLAHRVAVMEAGRVVELGDVLTIFQNPQQAITKRFVGEATTESDYELTLDELAHKYPQGQLWTLHFIKGDVEKPILATAMKQFDVEFSIIQGSIAKTKEGSVGQLTVLVQADEIKKLSAVKAYIEQQAVTVQEVNH